MKSSVDLEQPLRELSLAFFDLETTGLVPTQGDRVCEVAILRVKGQQIEGQFSTLVDPQRALEEQAFAINGISAAMLQGAPFFAGVADEVSDLLAGTILVAHNAPFDVAFLATELALLGRPAPANPVLDTLVLARRLLTRSSYSLQALANDLGVQPPAHRAMKDVLALRGVFDYLAKDLLAFRINTLGETLRYQRGLLPGQPEPIPPPLIDRAFREGRYLRIIYRSPRRLLPTERLVQPLELTQERQGVFLRAYCFLRNDLRSFALTRIEAMELA